MNRTGGMVLALLAAGTAPATMAAVEVSGVLQGQLVSVDSDLIADGSYLSDGGKFGQADGNGGNSGTLSVSALHEFDNELRAVGRYSIDIQSETGLDQGVRESYLGLDGRMGTLLLGNISTPFKSATAEWDPFYGTFMQARGNGGTAAAPVVDPAAPEPIAGALLGGDEGYMPNALLYRFTLPRTVVALMYAPDESSDGAADAATNGNDALSASINVNWEHVELALGYLSVDDYGQDTTVIGYQPLKRSNGKVGVRYHNDKFSVGLQWIDSDQDYDDGSYALLTTSYRSGDNSYSANYGQFNDADSEDSGTTDDMTYMALGMRHDFNKQVSGYIGYRNTEIETSSAGTTTTSEETVYGIGLRLGF